MSLETLPFRKKALTKARSTGNSDDRTQESVDLSLLLIRTGVGDRVAFAELYQRTSSRLFAVVLRIHRDRAQAEDILQDVYVNVWRAAVSFEEAQGHPLTWLVSVARNRAIDGLRSARVRPRIQTSEGVEGKECVYDAIAASTLGPLDVLCLSSDARALARCMDYLGPLQRESLELAFFEGLTHAEVATRMRQPLGTVKSWIRRALPALKSCLCSSATRPLSGSDDIARSVARSPRAAATIRGTVKMPLSNSEAKMNSIVGTTKGGPRPESACAGGGPPGYSLDCLSARPRRPEDFRSESGVLANLAARMVDAPEAILKCLSDAAMHLTAAHSAGVSILEKDEEGERFHWRATSGHFAEHLGGTMPGDRSPCGVVLQQRATLFMIDPVQYFPDVASLCRPVRELLLAPFYRDGAPVGTVWVVSHTAEKRFDGEDARLLEAVARFGSTAAQVASQREALESKNREMTQEVVERQRAEESARRLHLALEASHEQQRFVLDALAHELRNPLGTISNACAILKSETADESRQKALGIMDRQIGHMEHLLTELTVASRIFPDERAPLQRRIAMRSVVRRGLEMSATACEARGHELSLTLPNEELFVLGDETQLSQIVGNLLANAAKYTPEGGTIKATLSRRDEEALLEVEDNGIGIASDMLSEIFKMFVQVDLQSSRRDPGLGIGLAVVSRMVMQHRGTVVAHSAGLGLGSLFAVRLPLA